MPVTQCLFVTKNLCPVYTTCSLSIAWNVGFRRATSTRLSQNWLSFRRRKFDLLATGQSCVPAGCRTFRVVLKAIAEGHVAQVGDKKLLILHAADSEESVDEAAVDVARLPGEGPHSLCLWILRKLF